jgi:hypothetical protein
MWTCRVTHAFTFMIVDTNAQVILLHFFLGLDVYECTSQSAFGACKATR